MLVMAPALGGIIVAHEVRRALGVRALFTERQDGGMKLRRGFQLAAG
jgi:orotate phosphoribosyltransferase